MSAQISLETSDKETFKVDKEVAERSVMLKNMLEGARAGPFFLSSSSCSSSSSFFLLLLLLLSLLLLYRLGNVKESPLALSPKR